MSRRSILLLGKGTQKAVAIKGIEKPENSRESLCEGLAEQHSSQQSTKQSLQNVAKKAPHFSEGMN